MCLVGVHSIYVRTFVATIVCPGGLKAKRVLHEIYAIALLYLIILSYLSLSVIVAIHTNVYYNIFILPLFKAAITPN